MEERKKEGKQERNETKSFSSVAKKLMQHPIFHRRQRPSGNHQMQTSTFFELHLMFVQLFLCFFYLQLFTLNFFLLLSSFLCSSLDDQKSESFVVWGCVGWFYQQERHQQILKTGLICAQLYFWFYNNTLLQFDKPQQRFKIKYFNLYRKQMSRPFSSSHSVHFFHISVEIDYFQIYLQRRKSFRKKSTANIWYRTI